MVAVPEEVPFTELIQQPTRTTARLVDARALRLRRRGGGDLVLMSADRAAQEGEIIDLTARLLDTVLHDLKNAGGADLIEQALARVLPWVRFLPASALSEFAADLVGTVNAAAALRNMTPVAQLLAEWRHTAEVHADPELLAVLTRHHDADHGPAMPPDPL
jgi:hypothetical protein